MASFFDWRNTPSILWLNLPREVGGNISHCGRPATSLTWVAIQFLILIQLHPCAGSSGGGTPSSVRGFNYEMTVAVAGFAWTSMCHQGWWEIRKRPSLISLNILQLLYSMKKPPHILICHLSHCCSYPPWSLLASSCHKKTNGENDRQMQTRFW